MGNEIILKHGGYRKLKSFQVAQLVYDITVRFCRLYLDRKSRTIDQMVQAARSGVQNIAEGSEAAGISRKTEIKLTGVARASLEELKLDYEDFLRHRRMMMWGRNDWRREELIRQRPRSVEDFADWVKAIHGSYEGGLCGREIGPRGQTETSTASTRSTMSSPRPTHKEIAANGVLALITVACVLLDRQIASLVCTFENQGGFSERLYMARTMKRP